MVMDTLKEFRSIPFFTGYLINRDGVLYDTQRDLVMSWHVTKPGKRGSKGGYHMVKIRSDDGKLKNIGRHRLLALAFLGVPENVDKMVINHKNGIPGDDRIENLEWVTRGQNNQHAYDAGLKNDAKPVLVKNMLTGEITRYPTVVSCARALGYTTGTFIYWRLNRTGKLKRYSDELMFKYDDGTPWPEVDWFSLKVQRAGVSQDYIALNVFTRKVYIFRGLPEGEKITGVDRGTLCAHVNHGRLLPMNGFIVRFLTSSVKWPKFNDRVLAICKDYPMKQPNGIIVTDTHTGNEEFYTSTDKACKALGLKKQTIWEYHRGKKLYKKRFRISVFDIHKVIRSLQDENPAR